MFILGDGKIKMLFKNTWDDVGCSVRYPHPVEKQMRDDIILFYVFVCKMLFYKGLGCYVQAISILSLIRYKY